MTVKEMVANALYQRFCEEQGLFAKRWGDLDSVRKQIWMGVASESLGFSMETLREVHPWQTRDPKRATSGIRADARTVKVTPMRKAG